MNILAIADRPSRQKISTLLSQNSIDLIVTLGDLTQMELRELANIDIPKIGVYGNHDSGNYFEPLGIRNMHLTTWEFQGYIFGGFQGCVRYKQAPDAIMCTQDEARTLLEGYPRVDVFLAHCPMYGINDDVTDIAHTGFEALRDYVAIQKPKYFLHGHTYPTEETLVTSFDDTKIFYIYADQLVTI